MHTYTYIEYTNLEIIYIHTSIGNSYIQKVILEIIRTYISKVYNSRGLVHTYINIFLNISRVYRYSCYFLAQIILELM